MEFTDKIYIAGHRGMVGSGLERKLLSSRYSNIITRSSKELDLRNQNAVNKFFELEKQQIIDCYQQGFNNAYFNNPISKEQYYNETFKTN
jgi:GDP-L-fucose synthase